MDISIKNSSDLKAEILRLRLLNNQQGADISARFNSPSAIFSTFLSLFPKRHSDDSKGNILNQDFVGILSRILLPLMLNKTIFRNSNFIIKGLVGFLSQKASHFISEESVMGLWDKIRSLIGKKDRNPDYGIPPESEAS
jgi:hypothetical protein